MAKHHVKQDDRVGYVYETKNLINGKMYIGMHAMAGFDTQYLGSGTKLQHAIKKYGKENFSTRIIKWASSIDDLCEYEIELIAKRNAVLSDRYYNVSPGGEGRAGGRLSDEHKENVRKGKYKGGYKSRAYSIKSPRFVLNQKTQFFGVKYDAKRNAFVAHLGLENKVSKTAANGVAMAAVQRKFGVSKYGYDAALLLSVQAQDALYDQYFPETTIRNLNPDGTFSADLLAARAKRRWYGVADCRRYTKQWPLYQKRPFRALLLWFSDGVHHTTSCGHYATQEEAGYARDKKFLKLFGDDLNRLKKFTFNFEALRTNPNLELSDLI